MAETETFTQFVRALSEASPEIRLVIAKQLKAAKLYKGTPRGKFDNNFYDAILRAEQKRAPLASIIPNIPSRLDFITELASDPNVEGTGGSGAIRNQSQTYTYSATQSAKVLDAVSKELLGRELTAKEKKKYSSLLNAAQRANPSRTSGIGTGATTTQGGLDEQQFLTEKLAGTAEAKTAKANDAYSILMEELGGLR